MGSLDLRRLLFGAMTVAAGLCATRAAHATRLAGAVDHTITNGVHVVTAPLDDAQYEVRVARPNAKKFADGLLDRKTVAAHAADEGALVAINANFFGGDRSHPCGLARGHGETFPTIYYEANCLTSLGWSTKKGAIFDSSALFAADGKVTSPNIFPQFPDVVTGAGKLLEGGQARTPNFAKFQEGRNCTAIGVNATTKKIALVVTNRFECTAAKLRSALTAAGMTDAIHLDGGGSSKMWIKGAYVDDELEDRKLPVVVVIRKRPPAPVTPDGGAGFAGDASGGAGGAASAGDGDGDGADDSDGKDERLAASPGSADETSPRSADGSEGCASGGRSPSTIPALTCLAMLLVAVRRLRRATP